MACHMQTSVQNNTQILGYERQADFRQWLILAYGPVTYLLGWHWQRYWRVHQGLPTCIRFLPSQSAEPLINHEVPYISWWKIGVDFMDKDGKEYLIILDFFTKYPLKIPFQMFISTTNAGISHLQDLFSLKIMPLEVFTDNGFSTLKNCTTSQIWL